MRLLLPLGLLGLLAILLLIIIYILKPKYQEKVLSSTHIWKLSLKYKKQRIPLEWLKSSLIFILQVAILTTISLIMADPYLAFVTDSGEKILILDASASMQAERDGKTLFDMAKSEIGSVADRTAPNDRVTVILAGEEASFVVRRSDSAEDVKLSLVSVTSSFGISDIDKAMELSETVLNENPSAKIYYYTSNDFKSPGDVNVVNMANKEWNVAILSFKSERLSNGFVGFTAEIASYNKEANNIPIVIKTDGKTHPLKLVEKIEENSITKISWKELGVVTYSNAEISIEANDSFSYDNTFNIYDNSKNPLKIQILSDQQPASSTPYFINSALSGINSSYRITELYNEEEAVIEGFDLYIYDGKTPDVLPKDGAIWVFNPKGDLGDTGLSVSDTLVTGDYLLSSSSSGDTYNQIMRGVKPNEISVTQYTRVTKYPFFESILSRGSDPILLTKDDNGAKITVFAFDLAFSNIAVTVNFPLLINNLVQYSIKPTFDSYLYESGAEVRINTKPIAKTVTLSINGEETVLTDFPAVIKTNKPGVYTVTQVLDNETTKKESFFVKVNASESDFTVVQDTIMIPIVDNPNNSGQTSVELYDILPWVAGFLLFLLCAEWVVQYREQY